MVAFMPSPEPEQAPWPRSWLSFLRSNVFHYRLLDRIRRKRLWNDTCTFVSDKTWEGCRGLLVTEEMKVTIAAQACLMLLGREHDCFARVPTILVYPSGFQVIDEYWHDGGWGPSSAIGLAVHRGPVILAWDAVLEEGRDPSQGRNLVIHEFAHHLDFMDLYADGTLDFLGEQADRWEDIFVSEYNGHCRKVRQGHDTFLGDYAATNEREFFATASERFFTLPARLRHYHRALYEMLSEFYALDPKKWFVS